jgi:hypothetical protein
VFRKPKPNMIESDSGFSVERVEWEKLVYREGGKKLTVSAESLSGPVAFVVALGTFSDTWDTPFETVKISDEDFKRIADNIREAYRSQGTEIEVDLVSPERREGYKCALEQIKRGKK